MIIHNVTNVKKFFETVDKCNGKVELVTERGDKLNLKSKLSQYAALANIFSNGNRIRKLEIRTSAPEDTQRFISYMMAG